MYYVFVIYILTNTLTFIQYYYTPPPYHLVFGVISCSKFSELLGWDNTRLKQYTLIVLEIGSLREDFPGWQTLDYGCLSKETSAFRGYITYDMTT